MKYDSMCILPINIVNEKIYVFLWFWFYAIAIISAIAILYRLLTLFNPALRVSVTQSKARQTPKELIAKFVYGNKIGDWFLLDLIARNTNPIKFEELMVELAEPENKNGSSL